MMDGLCVGPHGKFVFLDLVAVTLFSGGMGVQILNYNHRKELWTRFLKDLYESWGEGVLLT